MNVPLRLLRREASAAADAFLLFAADFGPLAAACERLGPQLPAVFPVRGGFLLVPPTGTKAVPGAVRLRRVSGDLFIPADSVLSPTLLPDEIAALTSDRGLVVLPGAQVLSFDPNAPLPVGCWLAPARVNRGTWEPFPSPPDRAARLTAIERPTSPEAVIEVLAAGAPEGADPLPGPGEGDPAAGNVPESARPPAGSVIGGIAAGAVLGAGQLLAWLGRMVGAAGLARLGANLARKALESVPRLTEKLLGAQEAALREVLRQLQSGNVEEGLRRAPAAVPDPDRPARVGTDANLGTRNPRYSLRDLLGGSGGVATGWLGGGDVWLRLAQEYHRLAREAIARGDHRRAAYLYGVLLRDIRAAANALMAGGLYRDAAILYRDKLKDEAAAAPAFEQAGDYDEALRLYDKLGRFEQAGDLLRRLGDDDRAMGYFTRAADRLAADGRWVAAGDLIRKKAGDRAGAARYYRAGWDRDRAEAVACGERLLDELLVTEAWGEAAALFAEAGRRLAPPRAADAARFFNYALTVGSDFLPEEMQDDLADQGRRLFADHIRASGPGKGRAAALIGVLFGKPGVWAGPVVRDARFASRRGEQREVEPNHEPTVRLADGTVTAVAVARGTFDVVVATTAAVVLWRVTEGRIIPVCPPGGRVFGLSTDPGGRVVYVLSGAGDSAWLRCFTQSRDGSFQPMGQLERGGWEPDAGGWHLEPEAAFEKGDYRVTLATPAGRERLSGFYLQPGNPDRFLVDGTNTHLLVRHGDDWAWDWDERFVRWLSVSKMRCRWVPHWSPGVPAGSPLAAPGVDWLTPSTGLLEVAGVDRDGVLHWSVFHAADPADPASQSASDTQLDWYTAACLVAPRQVVAATRRNEIRWLRVEGAKLKVTAAKALAVPARVVTLVARPAAGEVVAILADGSAVRVPRP